MLTHDTYHRDWNDIKNALRRFGNHSPFWRSVVHLTYIFNLPYSPWGQSDFHRLKLEFVKELVDESSWESAWFQNAMEGIVRDRGIPAPHGEDGQRSLWATMLQAESCHRKGPQVKMMRWFSFFDSLKFHEADWHWNKAIWTAYSEKYRRGKASGSSVAEASAPEEDPVLPVSGPGKQDHKAELRVLRQQSRHAIDLALTLMTKENYENLKIMKRVVAKYWDEHGRCLLLFCTLLASTRGFDAFGRGLCGMGAHGAAHTIWVVVSWGNSRGWRCKLQTRSVWPDQEECPRPQGMVRQNGMWSVAGARSRGSVRDIDWLGCLERHGCGGRLAGGVDEDFGRGASGLLVCVGGLGSWQMFGVAFCCTQCDDPLCALVAWVSLSCPGVRSARSVDDEDRRVDDAGGSRALVQLDGMRVCIPSSLCGGAAAVAQPSSGLFVCAWYGAKLSLHI